MPLYSVILAVWQFITGAVRGAVLGAWQLIASHPLFFLLLILFGITVFVVHVIGRADLDTALGDARRDDHTDDTDRRTDGDR